MIDIKTLITDYATRFNAEISKFFTYPAGPEQRVMQAMSYSVMNGGKRLRPFLVNETAKLFGCSFAETLPAGVSLEMLHTYSLIHDDLPAMDNDDFRRGKPTCHKQYDEATAILAGDGLLTYAFEVLAAAPYADSLKIELTKLLARGAGAYDGMVAGQMLDLSVEKMANIENPSAVITHIEEMKTGRLLRYAVQAGALIGGADAQQRQKLDDYARKIGIAFQIADDILDITGTEAEMGKTLKKDAAQNKLTYVSCYGLENARQKAVQLVSEARDDLAAVGGKIEVLQALARFIIERRS